jgi:hypothetical protein
MFGQDDEMGIFGPPGSHTRATGDQRGRHTFRLM